MCFRKNNILQKTYLSTPIYTPYTPISHPSHTIYTSKFEHFFFHNIFTFHIHTLVPYTLYYHTNFENSLYVLNFFHKKHTSQHPSIPHIHPSHTHLTPYKHVSLNLKNFNFSNFTYINLKPIAGSAKLLAPSFMLFNRIILSTLRFFKTFPKIIT